MLLVLVAISVGLMLTATWLDGRRESVPVAQRIAAATIARHAAASGLDLASSTLDAEPDWRTAIAQGRLDQSFPIDTAMARWEVRDADDDGPVDDQTIRVLLRCVATVDGLEAASEQTLEFEPAEPVIDLGFGETAIIAERSIRVLDRSAILPWTGPGLQDVGPVVIGTLGGDPVDVQFGPEAIAPGTEVLVFETDSDGVQAPGQRLIREELPPMAAPDVPTGPAMPRNSMPSMQAAFCADSGPSRRRAGAESDGRIVVREDQVIRSLGDLSITDSDDRIVVEDGTLVLDATRDLHLRDTHITVGPRGSLILRAGRRLRIQNTSIEGTTPDERESDRGGMLSIESASVADRVLITSDQDMVFELGSDSLVVGTILAPESTVRLSGDAVLHGRIVASRVELRDQAIVYARPDDGRIIGLTAPEGPHRTPEGLLIEAVCVPERTDPETLTAIAEEMGVTVCAAGQVIAPSPAASERHEEKNSESIRKHRYERQWKRDRSDRSRNRDRNRDRKRGRR